MTSLKTSITTITYLSDIGCLEIQGASLNVLIPSFNFSITTYTKFFYMLFSARIDFRIIGGPINQLDIFFQDNTINCLTILNC